MAEEVRADLLLGRDTLSPGLVKAGQAASDASSNIRQLTRDLYAAGKVRATPVVDLNDAAAEAKLAAVSQKLRDLGARVANPEVSVKDKAAQAKVADMRVKLDALGRKVASPRVTLDGLDRAEAGILRLEVMMDKLGVKRAGLGGFRGGLTRGFLGTLGGLAGLIPGVPSFGGGFGSLLSALRGGGTGAAGATAGAAGAGGAGLGVGGIVAAGLPVIASLVDALTGFGVGAAGAGGVFKAVSKYQPAVLAPGLSNIDRSLSTVTQSVGPTVGLMFAQLGQFVKNLKPQLASLFSATLPFMKAFLTLAEQGAKIIIPALTQVMLQMVKSGALTAMTQAFVYLIQGVAGFITALGPGMKAGALVFRAIAIGIRDTLYGLGAVFGFLGRYAGEEFTKIRNDWDHFRHDTAAIFDQVRHDIAAIWDEIFNNTIGRTIRGIHDIAAEWDVWRHNTAAIFDQVRRDIASAWDTIWSNTVGRVQRGISDVNSWFKKLPGDVQTALRGLGSMLETIGKDALGMLWSGFKSVGSSILGWAKSFGGSVLNALKSVFGIASPSRAMFDIGRNLGLGLEHGLKSHYAPIRAAAGALGGSVTSWIRAAMADAGVPVSWLPALQRLVSLESGGNPRAVNPISVLGQHAEGLWQMLPSTFAAYGGRGSLFNPIEEGIAALRYIRSRYGSPFNIPGLFSGGYQGYAMGGMITEPIIGLGLQSGRGYGFGEKGPEMVTPLRGGEQRVVIEVRGNDSETSQFLVRLLKRHVRIAGGGNVQTAFATSR